jgi:DeoR/GlpR family transcriptional regulator of sugar metabolism
MKAAERQLRIREILTSQDFVDLDTLASRLDASESTVRRDLIALEEAGFLKRVHGGAVAAQAHEDLFDFARESLRASEEKRRIARVAAGLVEEGQTVILDGGSTVAAVARELRGRSLHVITNSIPLAGILGDERLIELTLTGGFVDPRLGVLLGPFCEQMLGSVAADLAIMGIGGITERGLSNNNTLVVGSEKKMIEVSRRVIIVTDHTKFGREATLHLAPLDVADVVVTDDALSAEQGELVRSHGVELMLA